MSEAATKGPGFIARAAATTLGRIVSAVFVPAATFAVLYFGFIFLRDSGAPQGVIAGIAVIARAVDNLQP